MIQIYKTGPGTPPCGTPAVLDGNADKAELNFRKAYLN